MSEAKHTPGPWKYEEGAKSVRAPDAHDGYNSFVCTLGYVNTVVQEPEINANGRLISASPELLEACEAALGTIETECDYSDDPDSVQMKLKRAIAKAKGEA